MVREYDKIQRQNNPDDQIGVRIEMTDLIVKQNEGSAQPYIPQNGEYALGGLSGDGWYCIGCEPTKVDGFEFNPFGGHTSGGGGQHPGYHRVSYNANKADCCTGGTSTIGNLTCNPDYRGGPSSHKCDDIYDAKCTSANMGDEKCRTWCAANADKCKARLQQYCTKDNMNLQYCRDRAKDSGGMDDAVNAYCPTHLNDAFCSCYTAVNIASTEGIDPELRILTARPECYVTKCSSGGGYKYDSMKNSGVCPTVNYCKNSINVVGSNDVEISDTHLTCNQNSKTTEKTEQINTTEKTNIQIFISKYKFLIIFIVVLLLALGMGAAIAFSGDDNNEDQHFLDLLARYNKKPNIIQTDKVETLPSADSTTTLNEL